MTAMAVVSIVLLIVGICVLTQFEHSDRVVELRQQGIITKDFIFSNPINTRAITRDVGAPLRAGIM